MYIDIHTHKRDSNNLSIINRFPDDLDFAPHENVLYSCGIHPWYPSDYMKQLERLNVLVETYHIAAIGECGLDSLKGSIASQEPIFRAQISIAENHELPLIIHCVKAYSDLIRIRKTVKPQQAWIIHGFNASFETADQLLRFNNIWLSLGNILFSPNAKLNSYLSKLPLDRILFETDESPYPIEHIYNQFASATNQNIESLKAQIQTNFEIITNGRILSTNHIK